MQLVIQVVIGYMYKVLKNELDTSKFKSYGELSGFGKVERQEGKRVSKREKKSPTDFALWKFSGDEI